MRLDSRGRRPQNSSSNISPSAAKSSESPHKGKTGWRRIIQALAHSLAGLGYAWKLESAFRQEVTLAAALLPLAFVVPYTPVERALLIATVLLVLVIELINSSIEAAVDRISLSDHRLSKRAKDLGSAAVLLALVLTGLVWLSLTPAALARL